MKFPFDFSITLIFRLIFPGLVLAAAFIPALHTAAYEAGLSFSLGSAFPFEVVFWGWLIVLADQPIYMLYEGRRYWPKRIWRHGLDRERTRLRKLRVRARRADPLRFTEESIRLLDFPLNSKGQPEARNPTRLGNLLASYETYPRRIYGLDAIFYWYRIWLVLAKELREELDQSQAIADSALYVSFSLMIAAIMCVIYFIMKLPYPGQFEPIFLFYAPTANVLSVLAIICFALSYAMYRIALFAQRQYGELFKALFDQCHDKLNFVNEVVELVGTLGGDTNVTPRERYAMVSRYLRWHRIRPPGEKNNVTPEAWQVRLAKRRTVQGAQVPNESKPEGNSTVPGD